MIMTCALAPYNGALIIAIWCPRKQFDFQRFEIRSAMMKFSSQKQWANGSELNTPRERRNRVRSDRSANCAGISQQFRIQGDRVLRGRASFPLRKTPSTSIGTNHFIFLPSSSFFYRRRVRNLNVAPLPYILIHLYSLKYIIGNPQKTRVFLT